MPESPMHWFTTYVDYHRTSLDMEQVPFDPCLLFHRTDERLQGIVSLQVDDTLYACTEEFAEKEEKVSTKFPSKGRTPIETEPVRYNGIDLHKIPHGYQMDQRTYISEIPPISSKEDMSFEQFRSVRAKFAYAAYSTTPDVLVYVAHLAQYTEDRFASEKVNALRVLKKLKKTIGTNPSTSGLKFVNFDPKNLEVVVCIDAAFAVNKDSTSQIGIVAMLRDKIRGDRKSVV